jgi:FkbM family methyltransferase
VALPGLTAKHVVIAQRYGTSSLRRGALRLFAAGYDCFFFDTALAGPIAQKAPAFAMGVPWWDYWLPLAVALERRSIVVCHRPPIVHLTHDTAWKWDLWRYAGLLFVKFLIANVRAPAPALGPMFQALDELAALGEPAAGKTTEFDQRLSDLGWLCVKFLGRTTANLQQADAGSAVSDPSRPAAAPDLPFLSLKPQNAFANFERRVEAGRAIMRAEAAARKDDRETADSQYRAAVEKTPLDAELLVEYGHFALKEGEPAILEAFLKAAAQHPRAALVMNRVGLEQLTQRHPEQAAWCFQKAVELDPEFFAGYNNLAVTLHEGDGYDEAMQLFAGALAKQPGASEGAELYWRSRQLRPSADITPQPVLQYFGRRGEDALLDAFFGFKGDGYFVDLGASDGIYLSRSYVFEKRGWNGLCIEPSPQYYPLCATNRPRSQCRNVACVGSGNAPADFRDQRSRALSGVQLVLGTELAEIEVERATLNDLLVAHQGEIDFISIDVEGHEMEVLAGFDLDRYQPRILLIEAHTGQACEALDTYLAPRGYRHARSILGSHFYVRSEEDRRRLRAITVSAKLASPPHPLGAGHSGFGYPTPPYVFWPQES